jgi:methylmalonyl-CoA mutase C-terminal domain/subunit
VDQIVSNAIQEDVDLVGLSILSGSHVGLTQKLLQRLAESGVPEKKVVVGGVIPREDIDELKKMGAVEVFPVGSDINWVVKRVSQILKP